MVKRGRLSKRSRNKSYYVYHKGNLESISTDENDCKMFVSDMVRLCNRKKRNYKIIAE